MRYAIAEQNPTGPRAQPYRIASAQQVAFSTRLEAAQALPPIERVNQLQQLAGEQQAALITHPRPTKPADYEPSDRWMKLHAAGQAAEFADSKLSDDVLVGSNEPLELADQYYDIAKLTAHLKAFKWAQANVDKNGLTWSMLRHALMPNPNPSPNTTASSSTAAPDTRTDLEVLQHRFPHLSHLTADAMTDYTDRRFALIGLVPGSSLAKDILTGRKRLLNTFSYSPFKIHTMVQRFQSKKLWGHFKYFENEVSRNMFLMPSLYKADLRRKEKAEALAKNEEWKEPKAYTAWQGLKFLELLEEHGPEVYKRCVAVDLGVIFTAAAVLLDVNAVINPYDSGAIEVLDSFKVSGKSLNAARKAYTDNLNTRKCAPDAAQVREAEQLLADVAGDRNQVHPPPEPGVLTEDIARASSAVADQVGPILRSFYSSPFLQRAKWHFSCQHERKMAQAVEDLIRMSGRAYTPEERRQRDLAGKTYYERALPTDPTIFLVGYGQFDTNFKSKMTSAHNKFQRMLVLRIMDLNTWREQRGMKPHVIFGVSEYNTTKKCPRCQQPFDFLLNDKGKRQFRVKQCYE
jgi:hypothetical protein